MKDRSIIDRCRDDLATARDGQAACERTGMPDQAAMFRRRAETLEAAIAELERLAPEAKKGTVRVRIACVISPNGEWSAVGFSFYNTTQAPDERMVQEAKKYQQQSISSVVYITADVPLPVAEEIRAEVVE